MKSPSGAEGGRSRSPRKPRGSSGTNSRPGRTPGSTNKASAKSYELASGRLTNPNGSPLRSRTHTQGDGESVPVRRGRKSSRTLHDDLYGSEGGMGLVDAEQEYDVEKKREKAMLPCQGPWKERWNMALLVLLYMMQGVPLGLTFGSLPFMLQSKMSYSQLAVFSVASYPYSMKLFWSPLVDSLYIKSIGRRKSWIIPVQLLTAWLMIAFAGQVDAMLEEANINIITAHVFVLVFMAATQDIAVDGWALTLLSNDNVGYASACQTIGTTTGYFTSFTVLLALINPTFCDSYVRPWPLMRTIFQLAPPGYPEGVMTLPRYLTIWGWIFVCVTIVLAICKREDPEVEVEADDESKEVPKPSVWKEIISAYGQLFSVMKLKAVWGLTAFLVTYRLGVLAAEGAYHLKLIDKGVAKETISFLVLFQFPIELASAFIAGRWASNHTPYPPLICGYFIRLMTSLAAVCLAAWFPVGASSISSNPGAFFALTIVNLAISFANSLTFTSIGSFFNKISDPVMGGAYLTMLNTIANLGYIGPKAPLFLLMDKLTLPMCTPPEGADPSLEELWESLSASCPKKGTPSEDSACIHAGGSCSLKQDGFYLVSLSCIALGASLSVVYMRLLPYLMGLPLGSWRAKSLKEKEEKED